MRIGVLGAGNIGGTLGALWRDAGHEVVVSSRTPDGKEGPEGLSLVTLQAAAAFGEVVLLAIPFAATGGLASDVREALRGKVVLDANNAVPRRDGALAEEVLATGRGSGRWTAEQLPGAYVVKAFNTVYYETMKTQRALADPVAVPLAGDHDDAVQTAAKLVRDAGMAPVVVGGLDEASRFDFGAEVWNSSATASEVRAALGLGPAS